LAARGARGTTSHSLRFDDSVFQSRLTENLREFQKLQISVVARLTELGLTEPVRGTALPDLSLFALFRKAKSAAELGELINKEQRRAMIYGDLAERIFSYCRLADGFSPNLLNPVRESLTVDHAPFGIVSLDFLGLGAENLRATAKALVGATSLRRAIDRARTAEREVTRRFNARKNAVARVASEYFDGQITVRFSGDDGILIPGREMYLSDQLQLLKALSRILPKPFFRMVTVSPDDSRKGLSSELISQAEAIEKTLRPSIKAHFGTEVSNKVHIGVFNTEINGHKKVFLILRLNMKFNDEQTRRLYALFHKAVKITEKNLRAKGEEVTFLVGDIFATGR
jgi:hypothetical protein